MAIICDDGKWGNGEKRKSRLAAAGYDYKAVQKIVNMMEESLREVSSWQASFSLIGVLMKKLLSTSCY